jgi:hypothetical protein
MWGPGRAGDTRPLCGRYKQQRVTGLLGTALPCAAPPVVEQLPVVPMDVESTVTPSPSLLFKHTSFPRSVLSVSWKGPSEQTSISISHECPWVEQPQAVQERVSVTPRKKTLRFGNALGHETSAFCEMQSEPKVLAEGKHAPPVQAWFEAAPPHVSRVVVQVLGVMVWEPLGAQVAESCAERQSSCVGGESHDPTGTKGLPVLPDPMKQSTLSTTQPQPQLAAGAFKPTLTLPRGVA